MKPSDILLHDPIPLTDVFGRAEAEQAAGLMISALVASDDTWRGVTPKEIGEFLKSVIDAKEDPPVWMNNPFFKPDIDDLIKREFAEWVGDDSEGRSRPVRFTPYGMRKLRRCQWNKARRWFMDSKELAELYRKAETRWTTTKMYAAMVNHDARNDRARIREMGNRFCARAITLIPRWRQLPKEPDEGVGVGAELVARPVWRCDGCSRVWDVFTDDKHPKGRCPTCSSAFACFGGKRPQRNKGTSYGEKETR